VQLLESGKLPSQNAIKPLNKINFSAALKRTHFTNQEASNEERELEIPDEDVNCNFSGRYQQVNEKQHAQTGF
jgi:hypothetical protein